MSTVQQWLNTTRLLRQKNEIGVPLQARRERPHANEMTRLKMGEQDKNANRNGGVLSPELKHKIQCRNLYVVW